MKSLFYTQPILKAKYKVLKERGEVVTRRLIKPCSNATVAGRNINNELDNYIRVQPDWVFTEAKSPLQVGDIVYWREPFFVGGTKPDEWVIYKDSKLPIPHTKVEDYEWQSPYSMSEKYARTFTRVMDVRPERLQKITIEDMQLEGVIPEKSHYLRADGNHIFNTKYDFKSFWDSTVKPGFKWDDNPWLWRYLLKEVKRND